MTELAPEDAKILTLARSARARTGAAEGAAVRDADGRTYAACSVVLRTLRLTALQAAVAAAVSSGAAGYEAAAVVSEAEFPDDADRSLAGELAVPLFLAGPDGVFRSVLTP